MKAKIRTIAIAMMLIAGSVWGDNCGSKCEKPKQEANPKQCEQTDNNQCAAKEAPKCSQKKIAGAEEKPIGEMKLAEILDRLGKANLKLRSYEAKMSYLFIQDPDLLESRRLQKGKLYYLKGEKRSFLRINFETLKQDDEKKQKHVEQYIFDGVWLTKIDHQNKTISAYQKAPIDKPIEAFEFINESFPMLGFTKPEKLAKEFEITLAEAKPSDPNDQVCLHLKVKKDSVYKNDYKWIDFWVDKTAFLPVRMITMSLEGDKYDIVLSQIKVNKKIEKTRFSVETPLNFSKDINPLKK